ncbi:MAG: hypothetical protein BMS9Abin12_1686 [Acidimicrobiia bacterium]|nr:MAG: hypothetical protein BMS9Abin12_1686 [Acidimicrobiia bacterium]
MTFWEFFFLLLIFIPLLTLWIFTLGDLAKRADLSGLAKGLWAVAVVFLPVIGMLIYFATRPAKPEMQPDPAVRMQEIIDETDHGSTIDQLEKLADLHESGTLSAEEFKAAKDRLLKT